MQTTEVSSTGTASIRLLWPFLALARRHGHGIERIVRERLNLTEAELDDPDTRVPQASLALLLNDAIARSGERDLGLLAARFVDNLGIGDAAARSERSDPNLRSALETGARYLQLLGDDVSHDVEVKGDLAVWRFAFSPALAVHEAAYEFVAALGVLRARRVTGRVDLTPLEVHFTHPRPASTRRHEKLFRCRLRFGAPELRVILAANVLEMPATQTEPQLFEHQADTMLDYVSRGPDTVSHVRTLLHAERDLSEASAPRIAQRLGVSVRTLSRRLRDEGTSYRNLLDGVRQTAAERELARSARPITQIALELGFASGQSFHRAFRRWTGTSAARFRLRAQQQAGETSSETN